MVRNGEFSERNWWDLNNFVFFLADLRQNCFLFFILFWKEAFITL